MPRPGGRGKDFEKAKDFKSAIKRLFKELKDYKVLISISLILAMLGSILSVITPNKLSDLTDTIQQGLVIKQDNLELITGSISENLSDEKIGEIIPQILEMDLSYDNIESILNSNISLEEKEQFNNFLNGTISSESLVSLPESVIKQILHDSYYEDVLVSSEDKLALLKLKQEGNSLPESVQKILLKEFSIDGVKVSYDDQNAFLKVMNGVNDDTAPEVFYAKIDEMPESIQTIVKPFMDIDKIKSIALFLMILYICSATFTYIESIAMTDVSNNFARKLRKTISSKINKLPLKYFDNHANGDLLSRVTNDIDTIAQSMNQSLSTLVSAIALLIGSVFMMFYTNWIMAITAIGASLLGFIFMAMVLSKSQKYFVMRQSVLGNLNGHIEEIYSGLNVVKAYNGQKQADLKFDEYNQGLYNSNRKSQFLSGLMMPMMNFIGNFGYVAVCLVGALLTFNGQINFGVIVAFILYVRLFTSPLSQIAQGMTSLQSVAASSERVFEFIDEEEMTDEKNIKKVLEKIDVKGEIVFDNVSFKYDGNEEETIHGFSAKALPGQKIAIVGPTGAGKTTMVNLLMKFYDINSGDIKIDGISTKELSRDNIHKLFTMVLQDTWLFDGTIKENIVYNRENVTDERVKEVCKTVGLDHFIKTLPNGYNSVITDNDSVSAGQRQLLTIARGMIEDSPFLILDEATSNVDTRTEELVQKAMDKLTEGKTSFIIAHRLSTIKNADLILVMKDGNIIEQGSHDELMKKKGFYSDLYNSQFEL